MTEATDDLPAIELKNPHLAAFLAWLIPGAGHFYQGRYAKGTIYLVCVLGSYLAGLFLGGGHVVYASWTKEDRRWQFICQAGVGLPVVPALVQNRRVMAGERPIVTDFLAPPKQPVRPGDDDHLAQWHLDYKWRFDLGTLYTMIAGLLNVLAVYDAFAGPMVLTSKEEDEKRKEKKSDKNRRPEADKPPPV